LPPAIQTLPLQFPPSEFGFLVGTDSLPIFGVYDDLHGELVLLKCTDATCSEILPARIAPAGPTRLVLRLGIDGLPRIVWSQRNTQTSANELWLARCGSPSCR
jgi:hypothetical protein